MDLARAAAYDLSVRLCASTWWNETIVNVE